MSDSYQPSLSEVMGAIMADVASARRIADEHAVRIAEHYQREPLLRGMSVPRVRVPEVVIDLPVVIEGYDAGAPERGGSPERVGAAAFEAPGRPPSLRVAVATDHVKTRADNLNVTRVRIRLREEGLEWSDVVNADGERTSRLTPE